MGLSESVNPKLLLVYPAAEFSTFDVATGIDAGLRACGAEVEPYRLYRRIQMIWAGLSRLAPAGKEPTPELACMHASEALVYAAVVKNCDWALVISGMGLYPDTLWALRRVGIRVAVWFTEAPYDSVDDRELELCKVCDLAFVNERDPEVLARFQAALDVAGNGGRAHYLRHAYNPDVHVPGEPTLDPACACDVLLVGTGFAERQALLEAVDWDGIDLKLGGLWPGITPPGRLHSYLKWPCIDNRQLARLYSSAKVVLNPHRWALGAESANPRVWEVAACGAFQISDYRAEVADVLGDAVPTYQPYVPWQLAALVRYWLAPERAAERQRRAALARTRGQGETFQARAETVLSAIREHDARRWREHGQRQLVLAT